MKHRGLAALLGLAALATGAVAVAEAEDALLKRYPFDPACPWGRVGNGKGMVVRCISEDEAKAYYAEHAKEFTTPSEVTLREILIEVPTTEKVVNVANAASGSA